MQYFSASYETVFDDNFDGITQAYNILPMLAEFSTYLKKVCDLITTVEALSFLENRCIGPEWESTSVGQADWSAGEYSWVFKIQKVSQVDQ